MILHLKKSFLTLQSGKLTNYAQVSTIYCNDNIWVLPGGFELHSNKGDTMQVVSGRGNGTLIECCTSCDGQKRPCVDPERAEHIVTPEVLDLCPFPLEEVV